jgi:hypothetical protein
MCGPHEWHTKFYPTTGTIANKCKCNSTVSYNYNSHVSYEYDFYNTCVIYRPLYWSEMRTVMTL